MPVSQTEPAHRCVAFGCPHFATGPQQLCFQCSAHNDLADSVATVHLQLSQKEQQIRNSVENIRSLQQEAEYTGKSVSYYTVKVEKPTTEGRAPYEAECNDIIEALKMNYAEGNAFKALWRSCAARNLGLAKKGYTDGLYDAEKVEFFGHRMVVQATK